MNATLNDVTKSTVRHWLKAYGLAVQARGCPPGSDVPRPPTDQSAPDFSLLSLSRVPCTIRCPIPALRKRSIFCATASMFSTYYVNFPFFTGIHLQHHFTLLRYCYVFYSMVTISRDIVWFHMLSFTVSRSSFIIDKILFHNVKKKWSSFIIGTLLWVVIGTFNKIF